MAGPQIQWPEECFSRTQVLVDAVAAGGTLPLYDVSESPNTVELFDFELPKEITDVDEELPPYECLSTDMLVVCSDGIQDCGCLDWTRLWSNETSRQPSTGCPTFPVCKDFLLFPSHRDCPSEQYSSIVSCFTDDMSSSTEYIETSSLDYSPETTFLRTESLRDLMPKGPHHENHHAGERLDGIVADWLSRVELDGGDTLLGHTVLGEGQNLSDTDEEDRTRTTWEKLRLDTPAS